MFNQYKILQELNFERLTATAGEKKAIDIISSEVRKLGFEVKQERFELFVTPNSQGSITVNGNKLEVEPYGSSQAGKIIGELCFIENADIIQYNPGAFKGKIIVSHNFSIRLFEQIERNGIAGFISISPPYRPTQQLSHAQFRVEANSNTPAATVTYEVGKKLRGSHGMTATLEVKNRPEKRHGTNLIVDIPGSGSETGIIYLVGHYDSVAKSPGAADNGAGTVNIIKILNYFRTNPPYRSLRAIFFSGEELGLIGSRAYVKKHVEEIKDHAQLVINIDMSGDPIGRNALIILGTKELQGYAAGVCREDGLLFAESLATYSSDCMPFAELEIPSINIARWGGEALHWGHTCEDRAELITPEGLEDTAQAGISILKRLLNAKIFPMRCEIDKSLKEKIEQYQAKSQGIKPDLNWRPDHER